LAAGGADAAGFDSGQRENLAQECFDARRGLEDARHEPSRFFGLGERALVEHLGAGAYGGHRILELVR